MCASDVYDQSYNIIAIVPVTLTATRATACIHYRHRLYSGEAFTRAVFTTYVTGSCQEMKLRGRGVSQLTLLSVATSLRSVSSINRTERNSCCGMHRSNAAIVTCVVRDVIPPGVIQHTGTRTVTITSRRGGFLRQLFHETTGRLVWYSRV